MLFLQGDAGRAGIGGFSGPPGFVGQVGLKGAKGQPTKFDPSLEIKRGLDVSIFLDLLGLDIYIYIVSISDDFRTPNSTCNNFGGNQV